MAKMTLSFDQKIILEVAHCTAVARLPQRLKLKILEFFLHSTGPFGTAVFEKFSKNVDFSL